MPKTSQMVPNSNGRKPLRTTTATLRNTRTSMPNGLAGCHPTAASLPPGSSVSHSGRGAWLVRPADARDGEDPVLEQRPGGRIGAERGLRLPADADGDDPAAAVLRGEPGQHPAARAVEEGDLHRAAEVGRARAHAGRVDGQRIG